MEDRTVCISCGRENPELTLDFLEVQVQTTRTSHRSGTRTVTNTQTQETLAGSRRASFCKECLLKKRKTERLWDSVGTLIGSFIGIFLFALMITGKDTFNSHALEIVLIAAGVALVLGILMFVRGSKMKDPFIAKRLLAKINGTTPGITHNFIPADPSLYCNKEGKADLAVFKKTTGLKTALGDRVFAAMKATAANAAAGSNEANAQKQEENS